MRRIAVYLSASVLLTITISGCSLLRKKQPEIQQADVGAMNGYLPPVEESAYEAGSYPIYGSPSTVGTSEAVGTISSFAEPFDFVGSTYESVENRLGKPDPYSGSRYHTVVRKDTLYGLARAYYGDQSRWKDIFTANRSTIEDPDKIWVGARLIIP